MPIIACITNNYIKNVYSKRNAPANRRRRFPCYERVVRADGTTARGMRAGKKRRGRIRSFRNAFVALRMRL